MNIDEKETLFQRGNASDEAVRRRLRAALSISDRPQKEIAAELGISPTTLNSQIMSGHPKKDLMVFIYRNLKIDFNFLLFGDFLQLSEATQIALIEALSDARRS